VSRVLRAAATIAPIRAWALLGGVYLTAMVLNVWRVWHYGPDTRFYLAWAYRFGGMSEAEAGRRSYEFFTTFEWFSPFCWSGCNTTEPGVTYDWLFRGAEGGLFAQRIVYPLLSAPFVRLFGPPGLLVVPVLAYTALVIMVTVLASRHFGRQWAVVAGLATVMPISITAFGLYAYTEAPAMALLVACVLTLPLLSRTSPSRRVLLTFAGLLVLFAFTRQFHYALVLGIVFAYIGAWRQQRSWRNSWLPFVGIGIGVTAVIAVIQNMLSPGYSLMKPFLQYSGAGTISGIPGVLPSVIGRIVTGEIYLAGRDFGLVVLAILGAIGLATQFRTQLAQLTAGTLVGIFGLVLVTTLPSQNRYWALAVPLLALLATGFLKSMFSNESVSNESVPTESPRSPDSWPENVPAQGDGASRYSNGAAALDQPDQLPRQAWQPVRQRRPSAPAETGTGV